MAIILCLLASIITIQIIYYNNRIHNELMLFENQKQITLDGYVKRPLKINDFNTTFLFQASNLKSKILVTGTKYPKFNYGDKLRVELKLQTVKTSNYPEYYKNYLYSKGIVFTGDLLSYQILHNKSLTKELFKANQNLTLTVNKNLTPEEAKLVNGILLGSDSNTDSEFKEKLKVSGLTHIVSVSGFNVMIIYAFLSMLFKFTGRKTSSLASLAIVYLYLLTIGIYIIPALRAFLMLAYQKTGNLLGYKTNILSSLSFSTIVLILLDFKVLQDVSFQLSVLAFLGLISLTESFNFKAIQDFKSSLAVFFLTTPYTFIKFGYNSNLGLIGNLLVLFVISPLTLFSVTALIFEVTGIKLLAEIFFYVTQLLSYYILEVVNALNENSLSQLNNFYVSIFILSILSLALLLRDIHKFKSYEVYH